MKFAGGTTAIWQESGLQLEGHLLPVALRLSSSHRNDKLSTCGLTRSRPLFAWRSFLGSPCLCSSQPACAFARTTTTSRPRNSMNLAARKFASSISLRSRSRSNRIFPRSSFAWKMKSALQLIPVLYSRSVTDHQGAGPSTLPSDRS